MTKTVRKLFFLWEYEKEEEWINQMAREGWMLIRTGFRKYVFEKGTPEEYTYRVELLDKGMNSKESNSYLIFLKDTGIELVGECNHWVYLRCKTAECRFDPGDRPLYNLTHLLKLQEFFNTLRNLFVTCIAACIVGILILEHFAPNPVVDFSKGFCTGFSMTMAFAILLATPFFRRINNKVKVAIKEMYTRE